MNELTINNTPVRTSKNYQINNIILDIADVKNGVFENCFFQDFDTENIEVSNNVNDINLTFGNSKELENQVNKQANKKLKIDLKGNTDKENIINFIFDENNRTLIDCIEIVVHHSCSGKLTVRYAISYDESIKSKSCNNSFCSSNVRGGESEFEARCNIANMYLKEGKVAGYHNGIISVKMEEDSSLELNVINLLGSATTNIISIENELRNNARLNYNIVDFGANSSITNYYSNLKGENSENNLNTIYLGKNSQLLDLNYIVEVRGEKSKVNIDVQGALKDNAKKHFKGTIDFKRGGKKAEGSENEFCMLLSDEAKSISLPMLLCDEEDVVGNHATAVGKVNNKELFYIMSRGFKEKEAKTLLVRARFNRVIEQITDENLKNELISEINYRLS